MEFTFVTEYNQTAVTAMAKALRKTVRSFIQTVTEKEIISF